MDKALNMTSDGSLGLLARFWLCLPQFMKNSRTSIVLLVAGLSLLADKTMAFPITLATNEVPDGGTTALLLAAGLAGVGLLRRFARRH
jgi:hypothetical protein